MLELDGINEGMLTVEKPDLDNEVRVTVIGFQSEQVYLTTEQITELRDFLTEIISPK